MNWIKWAWSFMCHDVILRNGPRDRQTVYSRMAVDNSRFGGGGGGAIKTGGACSRGRAPSCPQIGGLGERC